MSHNVNGKKRQLPLSWEMTYKTLVVILVMVYWCLLYYWFVFCVRQSQLETSGFTICETSSAFHSSVFGRELARLSGAWRRNHSQSSGDAVTPTHCKFRRPSLPNESCSLAFGADADVTNAGMFVMFVSVIHCEEFYSDASLHAAFSQTTR